MDAHFDTKVVQSTLKTKAPIRSKTTPIYQTSAYSFRSLDELEAFYQGDETAPYLYTRVGNPNTDELGQTVAKLENAEAGVATSSGLSAILAGVLAVAKQDDHIVATQDLYGGTYQLFSHELKHQGIDVSFVDFSKSQAIEDAIQSNTVLVYSESITNPLLLVEPIETIAAIAKKKQVVLMVDNTFATPYVCRPSDAGADLVVHSATKYIGGHSDVTAGVVVGNEKWITKARSVVVNLGLSLSPFEAWLACRGLKTLSVRMERQVTNAEAVASKLSGYQGIEKVYHPSLAGESIGCAIVTIALEEKAAMDRFFASLNWIKFVATLAGVETTVSYPIATSHRALPPELLANTGITKQHVRISVGIEHVDDIVSSLKEAVDAAY
ncbi:trans-sulfuration enzyme family protein [Aureibacillus halotolerans]|uniref:homocysteine desulfhydrase n=1 Tax=Aureibacillus halotolerans TaxID=1508390 RepID=A0A4R6TYC4_9BACI|nr:aminotransferase class I/II-fold pyridoxal phosphate-dependent enzyme [Aureibacillus halotolerans]TDQ35215.1 cystathionine beta-lyase/cystathionine gamma-synthase [Aureibacillus halotolerans]